MGWQSLGFDSCVVVSPKSAVLVLVHSNVFIALSATSVAVTTTLLAGFPLAVGPLFIVFAATLFVYNLNRITDMSEDATNVPGRVEFVRAYGRIWLAVGMLLYLLATGLAVTRDLPRAEFIVVPLLVGLLYSLRVKRILLLKNLLVGASWGLIPLGIGTYFGRVWTADVLFLAVYVCIMITLAAIVFDIKDIEGDRAAGIRTVPVVSDPRTTRVLTQAGNVLVGAGVIGLVAAGVLGVEYLVLLAFHLYVGAYIPFAVPERTLLFYGFVVDGEHVFLAALITLMEAFPCPL
ncbi:MAG: UbiA family prenyltransferase [Haloarculaceae archaeon]